MGDRSQMYYVAKYREARILSLSAISRRLVAVRVGGKTISRDDVIEIVCRGEFVPYWGKYVVITDVQMPLGDRYKVIFSREERVWEEIERKYRLKINGTLITKRQLGEIIREIVNELGIVLVRVDNRRPIRGAEWVCNPFTIYIISTDPVESVVVLEYRANLVDCVRVAEYEEEIESVLLPIDQIVKNIKIVYYR